MKSVGFLDSAKEDIRREKNYYRRISPALAERFQSAVETATRLLASNPEAMQIIEYQIRRWPLDSFPHGLLYRIEPEFILVLAVFHPSQAPDRWRKRVAS